MSEIVIASIAGRGVAIENIMLLTNFLIAIYAVMMNLSRKFLLQK